MTGQITPFEVRVSQDELDDLRERLARTRWLDEFPGRGWAYGTSQAYLQELCAYWRDGFDWRAAQSRLNQHPQFVTEIDGQDIHFLHIESPEPDAIPLILTHGWPGSTFEFLEAIGPLTDPASFGGAADLGRRAGLPLLSELSGA